MRRLAFLLIALLATPPAMAGDGEAGSDAVPKVDWLSYHDGILKARATGLPMLVWLTPRQCGQCGSASFSDPEIIEMLADFVPVRSDLANAAGWDLRVTGPAVAVLDVNGRPLPDLTVEADKAGHLPAEAVIDLMSSGLDVLR